MQLQQRDRPPQLYVPVEQGDQDVSCYAKCQICSGEVFGFLRTWIPCVFCFCVDYPYKQVEQGTEGMLQRFGRHLKIVKPGLQYVNPCADTLSTVDLRITVLDLDRQNIMTKDNVTISIDASVYYHIVNSRYAIYRVQQCEQAVTQVTYAILKNIVGSFQLQDLLEKRQEIADQIEKQVEIYVENWGVIIDNIYIKDIQLTRDLQDALSSAATEARMAQAKLITAMADVESAKMMRQAAEYLDSKTAMQVRYLETISLLGSQGGTRVCFIPDEKDKNKLMHHITQGLLS